MDTIFHRYLRCAPQKKAVAYYRCAAGEPGAIAAQRDSARAFAKEHNIQIIHEEKDDGMRGNFADRPGLKNIVWDWIMSDAAPPFDYLLLRDPSRWGRFQDVRPIELYDYLCWQRHIEVIYLDTVVLSFPS